VRELEQGEDIREKGIEPERIQKILSKSGITSRRNAEKMILDGRVCVNDVPATLGQSARLGHDIITVDGVAVTDESEHVYLMLNKPCGYITSTSDDRGRKTVMELVAGAGVRVYPVGRLDINSAGLLLFTNDGDFANNVMHPSSGKQKTYEVDVSGDVRGAVKLLQQPIEIDSHTVLAVGVDLIKATDSGGIVRITIVEGRNRQVRKMCVACGVRVDRLKRISIDNLNLGDLKTGQWRHLTKEEVKSLG